MNMEDIILENMLNILADAENLAHGGARQFHERLNPFHHLSDAMFVRMFRLNKQLVNNLIRLLNPILTPPKRAHDIDKQTKVSR